MRSMALLRLDGMGTSNSLLSPFKAPRQWEARGFLSSPRPFRGHWRGICCPLMNSFDGIAVVIVIVLLVWLLVLKW
jgi:hypothetical protein